MTPATAIAKEKTSSTTTIQNNAAFVSNLGLLNKIATEVSDADLYELRDEEKPSAKAILNAANTLGVLSLEESKAAEIEPFFGELGLIWHSGGRNKRVKAMFALDGSLSVYHEQIVDKRVTDYHLQPGATVEYLQERLAWLRA
jgi:hypothetical protein